MADVTFDAVLSGFGNKAVDALKITLGESWNALTSEERSDCAALMFAISKAHLYQLVGIDVSDHIDILKVAFQNWQVVGKQVVIDGVRKAATDVFGLAGAFAGGALAVFIKNWK